MKHVNVSANEIDKIVGNPKFQINLDNGSKDDVSKEPLDRPITANEVTKQNKFKISMSLNIFQPCLNITQQCYNNM
jgi:hypothetical protein